jgi:hypothetical protein
MVCSYGWSAAGQLGVRRTRAYASEQNRAVPLTAIAACRRMYAGAGGAAAAARHLCRHASRAARVTCSRGALS